MPAVVVTLPLGCGCVCALVDDDGYLFACLADGERGEWWCECAEPDDPVVCEHAEVLVALLAA